MRGLGWLLPGKSMSQELHEHQGLVDVAHALGDGVAQALVGGGGAWGHGGILGVAWAAQGCHPQLALDATGVEMP